MVTKIFQASISEYPISFLKPFFLFFVPFVNFVPLWLKL